MTERKEKQKQKFKERGITLIALVITIIVLLILAGVALSVLTGDSGILSNAEKSKEKTNSANAKEQLELAVQGAVIKAYAKGERIISEEQLKDELDNIFGTGKYEIVPGIAPWLVEVGDYKVIISSKGEIEEPIINAKATTPWLPTGFSHVEGTDLSNGLTIANTEDGKPGTQNYVWIEVPTTIEEKITIEVEGVSTTKTVKLSNAADETEIAAVLEAYAGEYTKGSSGQDKASWKDEWYDSKGSNVATDANKNDTAGCGMTKQEYDDTYEKMLNSIKKYGGFWLAQYEAGIAYEEQGKAATHRKSNSPRITNPTSANYAKDQYPYNWVYCCEAQKIANADSTSSYTSSLPFGIQWDLVCKFLEVKTNLNYDDIAKNSKWGNYCNVGWTSSTTSKYSEDFGKSFKSESKTKSSETILLTTGAIESTTEGVDASPMNIYDFAGNEWEWTLEYTASTVWPCAFRGGSYNYYPAAFRDHRSTTDGRDDWSFRSTLY